MTKEAQLPAIAPTPIFAVPAGFVPKADISMAREDYQNPAITVDHRNYGAPSPAKSEGFTSFVVMKVEFSAKDEATARAVAQFIKGMIEGMPMVRPDEAVDAEVVGHED